MFAAYDLEIEKCLVSRDGEYDPKYRYARGWEDWENLGISVISIVKKDEWITICPPHAEYWREMVQRELEGHTIIGYNNHRFDDVLLQVNGLRLPRTIDLLKLIRFSLFGSTDWRDQPPGFNYSLGAVAKANGLTKNGIGQDAPKLWQDGRHDEVIDYCVNDAKITYKIWKLGIAGELIDPNTAEKIKLSVCRGHVQCRGES